MNNVYKIPYIKILNIIMFILLIILTLINIKSIPPKKSVNQVTNELIIENLNKQIDMYEDIIQNHELIDSINNEIIENYKVYVAINCPE